MIYTISDLHLSLSGEKPMDIFGDNWAGHEQKIRSNWLDKVEKEMVILNDDNDSEMIEND